MANRPVYVALKKFPYVQRIDTEFKFFPGFSEKQKRLSINSLHKSFLERFPDKSVLEISSKSEVKLGVKLSAFNLQISLPEPDKKISVECAFQGSKIFENGGPYTDLFYKTSREAKKDSRIKNSGHLIAFKFFDYIFPLEPKTYFYDWLYINALNANSDFKNDILKYDCFTDIEFNPKKSLNCQAKAAAVFVGLNRAEIIDDSLNNEKNFLKIVYQNSK